MINKKKITFYIEGCETIVVEEENSKTPVDYVKELVPFLRSQDVCSIDFSSEEIIITKPDKINAISIKINNE
jgi:hypothetical protein